MVAAATLHSWAGLQRGAVRSVTSGDASSPTLPARTRCNAFAAREERVSDRSQDNDRRAFEGAAAAGRVDALGEPRAAVDISHRPKQVLYDCERTGGSAIGRGTIRGGDGTTGPSVVRHDGAFRSYEPTREPRCGRVPQNLDHEAPADDSKAPARQLTRLTGLAVLSRPPLPSSYKTPP
jgi:hypothetical protein